MLETSAIWGCEIKTAAADGPLCSLQTSLCKLSLKNALEPDYYSTTNQRPRSLEIPDKTLTNANISQLNQEIPETLMNWNTNYRKVVATTKRSKVHLCPPVWLLSVYSWKYTGKLNCVCVISLPDCVCVSFHLEKHQTTFHNWSWQKSW